MKLYFGISLVVLQYVLSHSPSTPRCLVSCFMCIITPWPLITASLRIKLTLRLLELKLVKQFTKCLLTRIWFRQWIREKNAYVATCTISSHNCLHSALVGKWCTSICKIILGILQEEEYRWYSYLMLYTGHYIELSLWREWIVLQKLGAGRPCERVDRIPRLLSINGQW